jgi:hypothetical protein
MHGKIKENNTVRFIEIEKSLCHSYDFASIGNVCYMLLFLMVNTQASVCTPHLICMQTPMSRLDRCIAANAHPEKQNLFGIVQGGLDTSPGGLREVGSQLKSHQKSLLSFLSFSSYFLSPLICHLLHPLSLISFSRVFSHSPSVNRSVCLILPCVTFSQT